MTHRLVLTDGQTFEGLDARTQGELVLLILNSNDDVKVFPREWIASVSEDGKPTRLGPDVAMSWPRCNTPTIPHDWEPWFEVAEFDDDQTWWLRWCARCAYGDFAKLQVAGPPSDDPDVQGSLSALKKHFVS